MCNKNETYNIFHSVKLVYCKYIGRVSIVIEIHDRKYSNITCRSSKSNHVCQIEYNKSKNGYNEYIESRIDYMIWMYFLLFTNIVTYIKLYDMVFKMLPAYDGICHSEMAVVLANVFVVYINIYE